MSNTRPERHVSRRFVVEALGEKIRSVKDDLERLQSLGLVRNRSITRREGFPSEARERANEDAVLAPTD